MLEEQRRFYSEVTGLPQKFVPMLGHMQERYNEIVLDGTQWRKWLPGSVDAFFMHAGSDYAQKAKVRGAREAFVRAYGLRGRAVPSLLVFDGQKVPPFWEAEPQDERKSG